MFISFKNGKRRLKYGAMLALAIIGLSSFSVSQYKNESLEAAVISYILNPFQLTINKENNPSAQVGGQFK